MAYLRHMVNGSVVSVYQLGDVTILGRHMDCGIHIDDSTVSSQHAKVLNSESNWSVVDLDSTNGVISKGKKVKVLDLVPGDTFSLGTHEFEFHSKLPNDLDKTLKIKKSWIPGVYYTE